MDYYSLCNQADKNIYLEDYSLALNQLEQSFVKVEYVHARQYEKASKCAIQINNFNKGYFYAKKSILNGNQKTFWNHKELKNFSHSDYYTLLKDSLHYFKLFHLKSINYEYKKIIDSLYFIDQNIIRKNRNVKGEYQIDKSELKKNLKNLDSLNLQKLLTLITVYGFPSEKNIGVEGYEKACMILHHNIRLEKNEKYHPMIIEAVFRGEYLPVDFEGMYEQYNLEYKNQTFFTTFDKNCSQENLKRINANRLKYGLKDLSAFKIKRKGLIMKAIW